MTGRVVRKRGEGQAIWMLGGLYEVKATGEETNGALTVMEMTIPVGMGPPLHTHPGGEAVYVLEGTARFHIGDETIEAGPGSFFYIAEGTMENFEPTSEIHVTDRRRRRVIEVRGSQIGRIDAARVPAVQIEKARTVLADVSGGSGQQPDGAHGIAAEGLALEALPHPEQ